MKHVARSLGRTLISAFLGLVAATDANAASTTWAAGSGSWGLATNWSPAFVPGAGDTVTINCACTVTISSNVSVDSVAVNGTSILVVDSSGSLTLAPGVSSTSVLTGTGALTVNGALTWQLGTVTGTGAFTVASGATLTITSGNLTSRTIDNFGTIVHLGGGLSGSGGAVVNNKAGAIYDLRGNGYPTGLTFNNAGTLKRSTSSVGELEFGGTLNNTGTVSVETGILRLGNAAAWTSSGAFTVSNGATLKLVGSQSQELQAGATLALVNGATLDIGGSLTNNANLSLPSTGTIVLCSSSSCTLSGNGAVTVNGTLNWQLGTVTGTGAFTVASGATLTITSGNLTGRTIDNFGTIVHLGGGLSGSGGAVVNNKAGAIYDLRGIGYPTGLTFNNAGTLKRTTSGSTLSFGATMNNTGTISVESGTLALNGPAFSQTAGAIVLAGGSLSSSNPLTIAGGELKGAGTVSANVTNGGTLRPGASPGTMTINGNYVQSGGGTLAIEIGGAIAGTQYDRLAVTGSASLAGTLNVSLTNGYVPTSGTGFQPLTYASKAGTFTTTTGLSISSGLTLETGYGATAFTLTAATVEKPVISGATSTSVTATAATLGGNVTSDGGSAITERGVVYSLTATNADPLIGGGGVTKAAVSGTTGLFSSSVTGLSPATGYTFKAYATNSIGTTYTTATTFTTSATVPGAPTIGVAEAGNGTVSVAFTAPASNGGSAITGYTATCGTQTGTGTGSPITVSGLTNGTAVTCTVVATNAVGNSAASAASNSVTPGPAGTAIPRLVNISTRGRVGTGHNIMIGGFIVGNGTPKKVLITGRGPSLAPFGVPDTLADPTIRLFAGADPLLANDDWQNASNVAEITATQKGPTNAKESAILTTVNPGVPYTVHLSGVGETSGIAIVEVFELDSPEVPLLNISTRTQVLTDANVMIGGFIIEGNAAQQVLITGKGPSMGVAPFNLEGSLPDPILELYQAGVTTPIETNDNWGESVIAAAIQASGNAPTLPLEAAIIRTLAPGAYTAIVKGKAGLTGIGLVEVFKK